MVQLCAYPTQRYIRELDITMRLQNRKIVLLIDNFSGQLIRYCPTNIRLEFFTPNMTPFVQPLNARIIRCFKAKYCALFCQQALELDTIGEEDIFKINIREAMLMAKDAWDTVQPATIKHCWKHTGVQHDPIMLCIPVARHGHRRGASQTSLEPWDILEDLATSQKTLPEAEEALNKVYGSTYNNLVWRPALVAITGSETTDAALDKLTKFKAAETGIVNKGARHTEAVETELMDAIVELKARNCIFGPLPSVEDLMNPPGKLEIGDDPDRFTSDANIIKAVHKGVSVGEDSDDEIEECSPPQMS
jgi:hypothetical protein